MSIAWKLFLSYLVVITVGAVILIVMTLSIAPATFSQHMESMKGDGHNGMMADLEAALNTNFNEAVTTALVFASVASILMAVLVSAFVAYRITRPMQAMVQASQRIASGHYDERLTIHSTDELGKLTTSFNQMATSLQEIEQTRQRLIGDISHELKTPLASIQAYMEGLQDGVISPNSDTFQQVQHETRRLQRLVHDLQELSRVEAGQMALQLEPHNITALIQSVVQWIEPQFEDKQIQLSTNLPDKAVLVQGDYDRLRQLLLNLLGNALQYTPPNGSVNIRCEQHQNDVILHIQDSGIGLSEKDAERIFERFYRVDKSRSRLSGGSGIGLTIARHIVQAHGGALWADSPGDNQGSTFHIRLPLSTSR